MKKFVALASLVLAFSLVACGGDATSKAAKEISPIIKAYGEAAKGIIAKYQAAKTADEVKAINDEAQKTSRESRKAVREIFAKYKDQIKDEKLAEEGNELGKLLAEGKKLDEDVRAARKAAEEATKKKDEKKK